MLLEEERRRGVFWVLEEEESCEGVLIEFEKGNFVILSVTRI